MLPITTKLLGLVILAGATALSNSAATAATADSILANKKAAKAPKRVYIIAKPKVNVPPGATLRSSICPTRPCVANRWKPRPSQ